MLGDDGRYHVVYELWLTNAKAVPATISRIEVLDTSDHRRLHLQSGMASPQYE